MEEYEEPFERWCITKILEKTYMLAIFLAFFGKHVKALVKSVSSLSNAKDLCRENPKSLIQHKSKYINSLTIKWVEVNHSVRSAQQSLPKNIIQLHLWILKGDDG